MTTEIDQSIHRQELFLRSGERRQVWTRDRASGLPVYLEDGGKGLHTPSTLACIVPDCNVQITLAEGPERRTHYRHLQGGGPAHKNPLMHAAGAMIEEWSRSGFTKSAIKLGDLKGLPAGYSDILFVEVLESGAASAIFVLVFAAIGAERWRTIYHALEARGGVHCWILDVSLFKATGNAGQVLIPRIASHLLGEGKSVLAIQPEERLIGTLISAASPPRPPAKASDVGAFHVCPIDDCSADPVFGMRTPAISRYLELRAQDAARKAREAGRSLSSPREQRTPPPGVPGTRSARPPHHAALPAASRVSATRSSWGRSSLHAEVIARFDRVPEFISSVSEADGSVSDDPAHWHADLYMRFILQQRRPFIAEKAARWLSTRDNLEGASTYLESTALQAYLEALVDFGELCRSGPARYQLVRS